MPLWLSESDVRAALPMAELIDAMQAALVAFSAGRAVQPVRTFLEFRRASLFGLLEALPLVREFGEIRVWVGRGILVPI